MKNKIKDINFKLIVNYIIRFLILGVEVAIIFIVARDITFLINFLFMSRASFSITGVLKLLGELIIIGAITKYGTQYSNKKVSDDKIEG